jgi:hypothetical protein
MIFASSQKSARYAVMAAVLVVMAGLLFVQIGHYALWDDETMVGLAAKGVARTGDTSVLMDHGNVLAYRGGILVRDFRDRSTPPLATYLAAVSFSLLGTNAWAARLPFATMGLATVALILYWARRESRPVLPALIIGLLGNVSLILFFRECRYCSPAIFFSVASAFVYWRWQPTPRTLLTLAGLSVLLFASNCMNYLALYACLAVDYVIWKRKDWPPTWKMGLLLFGPQAICNGAILCVWNPLRTQEAQYEAMNSFWDRLTLFVWYWRDLNQCEFLALPMLLLALVIGLTQRRVWFARGCVALLVYVTAITLITPQPVRLTSVADVRYMPVIIPLAIALEAGALCILFERQKILLIGAALIVFGTNLLNGGPFLGPGFRSTLISYVGELLHPPPEPYSPTADWINRHVPEGCSIWVLPDYATYPLMFHAPRALYAWQLDWPPRADFAGLPLIHFKGQIPPDYLIAFGPSLNQMAQAIQSLNRPDVSYKEVATIDVFWKDLYRPELFWRTFAPIKNFDPGTQAIYIFQRTRPPVPAK